MNDRKTLMGPSQREQEGVLTFKCCIKVLFFIFGRESCVLRINYLDDWKYLRSYDKRESYYCFAPSAFYYMHVRPVILM